jgi:ketosteroid isomerase-like protein
MAAERAPEVEELIRELNRAYNDGDVESIVRRQSKDPAAMAVGSDPNEVARGPDEVASMFRGENEERTPDSPRWSPEEVVAYSEGNVAWATVLGPYEIGGGSALQGRGIGVLHREEGEWKIVSWVFSFAVPNHALEQGSPVVERLATAKV